MPPVLVIIFNRPEPTQKVFEAIRKARPARLFISADGPRGSRTGEDTLCKQAREITEHIDWPCEVSRKYSDTNLGCKKAVSGAITWFFQHVEAGIILEDDCLPDQSFFPYAEELLERYRDNSRIMHVSGTTFLSKDDPRHPEDSYHFSRIDSVWGWATWRRAWELYDIRMPAIDELTSDPSIAEAFSKKIDLKFWIQLFRHVRDKNIDTWDAQWLYSILSSNGISITPHANLISNIGFDQSATHTKDPNSAYIPLSTSIDFPLVHPASFDIDRKADQILMERIYLKSSWLRLKTYIK